MEEVNNSQVNISQVNILEDDLRTGHLRMKLIIQVAVLSRCGCQGEGEPGGKLRGGSAGQDRADQPSTQTRPALVGVVYAGLLLGRRAILLAAGQRKPANNHNDPGLPTLARTLQPTLLLKHSFLRHRPRNRRTEADHQTLRADRYYRGAGGAQPQPGAAGPRAGEGGGGGKASRGGKGRAAAGAEDGAELLQLPGRGRGGGVRGGGGVPGQIPAVAAAAVSLMEELLYFIDAEPQQVPEQRPGVAGPRRPLQPALPPAHLPLQPADRPPRLLPLPHHPRPAPHHPPQTPPHRQEPPRTTQLPPAETQLRQTGDVLPAAQTAVVPQKRPTALRPQAGGVAGVAGGAGGSAEEQNRAVHELRGQTQEHHHLHSQPLQLLQAEPVLPRRSRTRSPRKELPRSRTHQHLTADPATGRTRPCGHPPASPQTAHPTAQTGGTRPQEDPGAGFGRNTDPLPGERGQPDRPKPEDHDRGHAGGRGPDDPSVRTDLPQEDGKEVGSGGVHCQPPVLRGRHPGRAGPRRASLPPPPLPAALHADQRPVREGPLAHRPRAEPDGAGGQRGLLLPAAGGQRRPHPALLRRQGLRTVGPGGLPGTPGEERGRARRQQGVLPAAPLPLLRQQQRTHRTTLHRPSLISSSTHEQMFFRLPPFTLSPSSFPSSSPPAVLLFTRPPPHPSCWSAQQFQQMRGKKVSSNQLLHPPSRPEQLRLLPKRKLHEVRSADPKPKPHPQPHLNPPAQPLPTPAQPLHPRFSQQLPAPPPPDRPVRQTLTYPPSDPHPQRPRFTRNSEAVRVRENQLMGGQGQSQQNSVQKIKIISADERESWSRSESQSLRKRGGIELTKTLLKRISGMYAEKDFQNRSSFVNKSRKEETTGIMTATMSRGVCDQYQLSDFDFHPPNRTLTLSTSQQQHSFNDSGSWTNPTQQPKQQLLAQLQQNGMQSGKQQNNQPQQQQHTHQQQQQHTQQHNQQQQPRQQLTQPQQIPYQSAKQMLPNVKSVDLLNRPTAQSIVMGSQPPARPSINRRQSNSNDRFLIRSKNKTLDQLSVKQSMVFGFDNYYQ